MSLIVDKMACLPDDKLAELAKQRFFRGQGQPRPLAAPGKARERRIQRRAFRWSKAEELRRRPRER